MTEITDDRTWWSDVEHLHPDGTGTRTAARTVLVEPPREDRGEHQRPPASSRRSERPAVLQRADAAAFADAMDLDGAFGAPARSSGSREIVLTGAGPRTDRPAAHEMSERAHGAPARDRRHERTDTGTDVGAPRRRPAREPQGRSSRTAAERLGGRPDRVVMWVVMLGAFLVLIAAAGSSAGS